ncbi:MAG: class I SAM-dependent methyltransferase [Pseudomonadota bacterium]|nr:class I SAM-dependent methyltransferase [Pseudomonadota bacterium]
MSTPTAEAHWEQVYRTKAHDAVSWYRPHLETSLRLISQVAPAESASVIDIGGGESTLPDDLIARGYRSLTVLDLSQAALEASRLRIGDKASALTWITGDITSVVLPEHAYDVWHDRAVFHFMATAAEREAYLAQLHRALRPGGYLVLATFGLQGPEKCSGLAVSRYDAAAIQTVLGPRFTLMESLIETHLTPAGASQQFQYGLFRQSA